MSAHDRRSFGVAGNWLLAGVTAICLAACGSNPPAPDDNAEAKSKLADAVASGEPITDAEALKEAIDAGYELRYRDGERVYCKREQVFGTRVRERTVCLTAEEIQALRDDARDYMDEASRRQLPPRPPGG
ncbi:MAG TPA: hypothetical protein VLT59_16915 [Steroidobacteraceae bacterium]|nr:hypothetical protein [Steroidobacteraceae bacterium]